MKSFVRVALFFLPAMLGSFAPLHAQTISTGNKEVIYTAAQRSARGLPYWPDGNLGVIADGAGGFYWYAANSTASKRTQGPLTDPGQAAAACSIVGGAAYNYKAGGPVYRDPATGRLLLFYHAEIHQGGDFTKFYSVLGLAISEQNLQSFYDCGVIVQAQLGPAQADAEGRSVEMCGAPFVVHDGKFRVYFRDTQTNGAAINLAVAEASVASVVAAATNHAGVVWTKYYNGSFSQPGIGGLSSPLESGNPSVRWMDVRWNDYLNQYVMVTSVGYPGPDLYLSFSSNGVNWSARTQLENESGESFYPTLVGTGADPQSIGQSFYVYYTHSAAGDFNRWNDALLVRRLITLDPDPSNPPVAVATSLICRLQFEDGAGSTAADSSGWTNHATLLGQTSWGSGAAGGGARLDPADGDDYLTIPNNPTTDNLQEGNFTLMAWFKPLSVPSGSGAANNAAYGLIMKNGYHSGLKYQNGGTFIFDQWLSGNTWSGVAASGFYATGVFWHVAGVYDRSNGISRIYVNGSKMGEAGFVPGAVAREYATTAWKVGVADPGAGSYRWPAHGVIDDVRLYAGAMSAEQIAAIANDADEDTLSDAWERTHFGSLSATDGDADWDQDDFSDREEFLAGTEPTNALSRLAFTQLNRPESNAVELTWATTSGHTYRVLSSPDFAQASWTTNVPVLAATPPANTITVTINNATQFYKVELMP